MNGSEMNVSFMVQFLQCTKTNFDQVKNMFNNITSFSVAVPAGSVAVRPLLCFLWSGWYHLLRTDLPQPDRGLLSPSRWKKPL